MVKKFELANSKSDFWVKIKFYIETKGHHTKIGYIRAIELWCSHLSIKPGSHSNIIKNARLEDGVAFVSFLKNRQGDKSRTNPSDTGMSINYILKNISFLRSLYRYLEGCGEVSKNPFNTDFFPKIRKRATKRPTQAVPYEKVIEVIEQGKNPMERALVAVLFGGGLRRSEANNLLIGDIVHHEDKIGLRLRNTKSDESGIIQPIGRIAYPYLTKYISQLNGQNRANEDRLFSVKLTSIYSIFKRCAEPILGAGFSPHSCRATAITRVLEVNEGDYRKAQKFARHKNLESTLTYDKRRMLWHEAGVEALK